MSKGAQYVKVQLAASERTKSLVGYRIIADITSSAGPRQLLLERPDLQVAPEPKPKPRRKRRTKAELAAARATTTDATVEV